MKKDPFHYILFIALCISCFVTYLTQFSLIADAIHAPQVGTIPPTTDCTYNPWQFSKSLTTDRHSHASVSIANFIFTLGGYSLPSSIERTVVNEDGTLGAWALENDMLSARKSFATVTYGGNIYALGGNRDKSENSVERAVVSINGSLSPWQIEKPMLIWRISHAAVVVRDRIYIIGGYTVNGSDQNDKASTTVESSQINPDGTLADWRYENSMLVPRGDAAAVTVDDYIYIIGGTSGETIQSSVARAYVNSDGTLAPWEMLPSMNLPRTLPSAVAAGGYIYVFGGYNGTTGITYLNSVERAKVDSSGLLDSWQFLYPMQEKRAYASSVVARNHIYVIGGADYGNISNTVEQASIGGLTVSPDYGLTINEGSLFTNRTAVTLTVSAKPGTVQMQVSNDGSFSGAEWEPCALTKVWTITQLGNYVIPRVVYIRFKDNNGNISATFQDDIILDVTPPSGSIVVSNSSNTLAKYPLVTLTLRADDDVSGVADMMISDQNDFTNGNWQNFETSYAWSPGSSNTVYVKFRDNAKNISETYSASTRENSISIYLPLISR